jgi:elongator complex protein 1
MSTALLFATTQAPALGLSSTGALYWGSTQVATEVTSFTVRVGGPGGPALLYCTRRNLLYTVFFTQVNE